MAAIRGFSLEKLSSVRLVFSVFDSRATSTRCAWSSSTGTLSSVRHVVLYVFCCVQGAHAQSDCRRSERDQLEM